MPSPRPTTKHTQQNTDNFVVNLLVKDGPAHESGSIQQGDLLLSINTKGEYQRNAQRIIGLVYTCMSFQPESHSLTRIFFLCLLAHSRSTP